MGFNGPVALNLEPVFKIMDLYEVDNKKDCLDRIRYLYQCTHEKLREKYDKDSK